MQSLFGSFLSSNLGEWLKLKTWLGLRRRALDDPVRCANAVSGRRALFFALFFLVAPYVIVFALIDLGEVVHVLPKHQINQAIDDIEKANEEISERVRHGIAECRRSFVGRAAASCEKSFTDIGEQNEADSAPGLIMLKFADGIRGAYFEETYITFSLALILNAYLFSVLWLKAFPVRVSHRKSDRKRVQKVYLLCLGTSLYYPTLFSGLTLFGAEIVSRFDPVYGVLFPNVIMYCGLLPMVAGTVLTAQRCHYILCANADWRIGRPLRIIYYSNTASSIVALSGLVLWAYLTS